MMPKRIWTAELVIEELRRIRCQGPRANRKVDDAARRCFGSVRAALRVAGLPCGQPERRNKGWTKKVVVEAIRQRHFNGKSLLRTNREDRALYEAAKNWFGSWSAALIAAGFPKQPREYYTADEVRLIIIEMYERELPLSCRATRDLKLRNSCKKHFGGWRNAVESLGLGDELRRMWTPQKVIEAIVRRRAEGYDLSKTLHEDIGLFTAAKTRFGSWNKALVAAGIDAVLREQWSEEKVLMRIGQLIQEIPRDRIRSVDPKLACAAERRFGSIRRAVSIAINRNSGRKARLAP